MFSMTYDSRYGYGDACGGSGNTLSCQRNHPYTYR